MVKIRNYVLGMIPGQGLTALTMHLGVASGQGKTTLTVYYD